LGFWQSVHSLSPGVYTTGTRNFWNCSNTAWFQPGFDAGIGGSMPALVHGWLPEWMSPTWISVLTERSAFTESTSRFALASSRLL
jgi:hypothetical protein